MKLNTSKVIFITLAVMTVISVTTMYYRFYVLKDFEIFYDDYGEIGAEEDTEGIDETSEVTEGSTDEPEIPSSETE